MCRVIALQISVYFVGTIRLDSIKVSYHFLLGKRSEVINIEFTLQERSPRMVRNQQAVQGRSNR